MRHVHIEAGADELVGTVEDTADLDSYFTLTSTEDHDRGAKYRVCGWNVATYLEN